MISRLEKLFCLLLCPLLCPLLYPALVAGQAQPGFMPTIDGSNVMLGAVLHESSKEVVFDPASASWSIVVEVQAAQDNTHVLPMVLDQGSVSLAGRSLNWIADPVHFHWQYACVVQDLLVQTRYVNLDLYSAASEAGDCWLPGNDVAFVGIIEAFDGFRRISSGISWTRDGLLYNVTVHDREAERLGWAYEADGLRVLDFRILMLFVRLSAPGSTYVEVVYVPFQSVLLRDARTWGTGFQRLASDCESVYEKPALSSYAVRKDDFVAGAVEYCDWYCLPGLFMYPQHAAWRQRYGETLAGVGSECRVPQEYGIVVGLSAWFFLDMNRSMEEAGVQDVLPRYWNMSIPRMGWWLDELVSRRVEAGVREALTFLRPYGVRVLSEFHDQQYAEEWRLYLQSLRGLYERLTNRTVRPAVNIHSNLSGYTLPSWMEDLGVFTMNNLDFYGVPNTSWLEGFQVGNQVVTSMDVVALEMVVMIDSDRLDMGMLTELLREAFEVVVRDSNGSVYSVETLLRDMTVRPLLPSYMKDWRLIYIALGSFASSLLLLFFMFFLNCRARGEVRYRSLD
jgi:hypothetical protein